VLCAGLVSIDVAISLITHAPSDQATDGGNKGLLPVAFWVYGGGFTLGSELVPLLYHPRSFTDRGVVFVSFAYRLGTLGLCTPNTNILL
jgi:carboxylesterase type B